MRYVPYEKMSKKERRTLDQRRRGSWNGLRPVTRRAESKKTFCRAKVKNETQKLYR